MDCLIYSLIKNVELFGAEFLSAGMDNMKGKEESRNESSDCYWL